MSRSFSTAAEEGGRSRCKFPFSVLFSLSGRRRQGQTGLCENWQTSGRMFRTHVTDIGCVMPQITLNESPKLGDELELFPLSLPVGFTARHPRIVRSKRRVNAFVMMWPRDGMALWY